jgi:NAD+ diphosphatase
VTAATGSPLEGRLALARSATDRSAEHRTDDAWLTAAWADPRTRVLRISEGRTLVDGDRIVYCSPDAAGAGERYFLGVDADDVSYFAVAQSAPLHAPLGSAAVLAGLREVGGRLDDRDAGLLVLAVGLANWHATHTHCPRCGSPTEVAVAGFVRRCPADASEHYPRTDPAIIVLVTDATGDRCLLGSSARWTERRFSTLAGFVEPGESAEAAVIREVAEESGVAVGDVDYLGSQPWPFPSSLMLGFTARAMSADAVPEADGEELVDVRWFTRAELEAGVGDGSLGIPPSVSIARRLIEHWYGSDLPDPVLPWAARA